MPSLSCRRSVGRSRCTYLGKPYATRLPKLCIAGQKHHFLSPPLTLNPQGHFGALLQGMLGGEVLASLPFFDQKKVTGVPDSLHTVDESSRVAHDQALMMILSAFEPHDCLRLSSGAS